MKDRIQRLAAAIERAIRETGIRREGLRAEAEILRLNGELREKVELLSRSNAELDQFATIASHDLKEPLRTVTLYTELLLRRRAAPPNSEESKIGGYITSAVERMRALIDGLLAYSKIAHESRNPEAAADAGIAASNALISLRGPLAESGALVTVERLPTVVIESVPLTQIFQNLIANALKYRRPDEPPRIHISGVTDHGTVRLSVRDNGMGISPAHYERIFVLFRRLHGEEYPGIGLGLAVCKRIVEQSGGEIWLESELGVGSTFHFTLFEQSKAAAASVQNSP
jgi:light-regulated signal transduction histidine kinase (bacteriophytochrome)